MIFGHFHRFLYGTAVADEQHKGRLKLTSLSVIQNRLKLLGVTGNDRAGHHDGLLEAAVKWWTRKAYAMLVMFGGLCAMCVLISRDRATFATSLGMAIFFGLVAFAINPDPKNPKARKAVSIVFLGLIRATNRGIDNSCRVFSFSSVMTARICLCAAFGIDRRQLDRDSLAEWN
jgi:hypothetical protein